MENRFGFHPVSSPLKISPSRDRPFTKRRPFSGFLGAARRHEDCSENTGRSCSTDHCIGPFFIHLGCRNAAWELRRNLAALWLETGSVIRPDQGLTIPIEVAAR
jgi:hypothetical protein